MCPVDNANYNLTKDKCCYHLETGLVVDNDCDETLDLVQTIQNELENGVYERISEADTTS